MIDWHVKCVEVTDETSLRVTFADGISGMVRFESSRFRDAFAPLREPKIFSDVKIEHGALTWLNGEIDLAPDAMYDQLKAHGEWRLS